MLTLQETICFKLMMIRDKIQDYSRKEFQEIGITYGNYVTMLLLYENPGITQAELAEVNHKDRNVIGQIVDKLEKKQFLERIKAETDRRAYTLFLTPKGKEIVETCWEPAVGGEDQLLKNISPEERIAFCTVLDKLSR